jgi:hypothetical protein
MSPSPHLNTGTDPVIEVGSIWGTQQSRCLPPFTWTREQIQLLRLALSEEPNRVGVSLPASTQLKTETDPVPETVCSPVFSIPGDGQSPQTH